MVDNHPAPINSGSARLSPRAWLGALAVLAAFAMLVSLGVWQLQRLAWKEDLIAQLEARRAAAPVSITEVLKRRAAGDDVRYLRARVTGTYRHDHERFFYAPKAGAGPGFDVYTPLELAGGQGLIMVNRGFVPERFKAVETRSTGRTTGPQEIVGLVRLPGSQGWFTPDNNQADNIWFWRDFDAMTDGVEPKTSVGLQPLYLFLDAERSAPGGWPSGADTNIALSNRHFGYALTWFGLAAALLVIFGLRLRARNRN